MRCGCLKDRERKGCECADIGENVCGQGAPQQLAEIVGKLGTWLQWDSFMAAIVTSQITIPPGLTMEAYINTLYETAE
jgi:hypothetical protein